MNMAMLQQHLWLPFAYPTNTHLGHYPTAAGGSLPAKRRAEALRQPAKMAWRAVSILLRDRIPLAQGLETQRRHGEVSHPPLRQE